MGLEVALRHRWERGATGVGETHLEAEATYMFDGFSSPPTHGLHHCRWPGTGWELSGRQREMSFWQQTLDLSWFIHHGNNNENIKELDETWWNHEIIRIYQLSIRIGNLELLLSSACLRIFGSVFFSPAHQSSLKYLKNLPEVNAFTNHWTITNLNIFPPLNRFTTAALCHLHGAVPVLRSRTSSTPYLPCKIFIPACRC